MSDRRSGIGPLGYLIIALVVLSLGLLYFFINQGFSFWGDRNENNMPLTAPAMQDIRQDTRGVKQPAVMAEENQPLSGEEMLAEQAAQTTTEVANEEKTQMAAQEVQTEEPLSLPLAAEDSETGDLHEDLQAERTGSPASGDDSDLVTRAMQDDVHSEQQMAAAVEPSMARSEPEPKRKMFNLPDGTEIEVPDSGFGGRVKTAMVKRTLNTPLLFDAIQFESGSSRLSAGSGDQIRVAAALMNTYKDIRVLIRGHTDNVGAINENSLLSLMRSDAVKQQLAALGIEQTRIRIEGVGQLEPLTSNATADGRNKNRRIELVLIE